MNKTQLLVVVLALLVAGVFAARCSRSSPCASGCCSRWGYCGASSAYCGPGCQSGPCHGSSSGGSSSTACSRAGGVCKDYRSCTGTTRSGMCPGSSSNRCCFASSTSGGSTSSACSRLGGVCKDYRSCTGSTRSGLCPGSSSNRCCLPSTTSGGSSSSGGIPSGSLSSLHRLPAGINRGVSAARQSTMKRVMDGVGCRLTRDCSSIGSWYSKRALYETRSVGPIRLTGIKPALDAITRVFAKVKKDHPDVYAAVGTAGMTCCRAVRGSTRNWSNHSWGTAVDLKIDGKLDPRGDGRAQKGLIILAKYFNEERFYWGAGFSNEDAMHFEVSDELIQEWSSKGWLNV